MRVNGKSLVFGVAIEVIAVSMFACCIVAPCMAKTSPGKSAAEATKMRELLSHTALIIVDVQGDFTEAQSGSLAVRGTGKDYVNKVIAATRRARTLGMFVVATADNHPRGHVSFASAHPGTKPFDKIEVMIQGKPRTQELWPDHCVAGTPGAEVLVPRDLLLDDLTKQVAIVPKGTNKEFDSYSGFYDNNGTETDLDALLHKHDISHLAVVGIATDYCVRATALHGIEKGYQVALILSLCRGVAAETIAKAVRDMQDAGVKVYLTFDQYYQELRDSVKKSRDDVKSA